MAGDGGDLVRGAARFREAPCSSLSEAVRHAALRQASLVDLDSIENAIGSSGGDTISGSGGVNRIEGGGGNDWMSGNGSNDFFVFKDEFGNDRVFDFDANPSGGQDLIELSGLGINGGNFASRVTIADAGADTLITIDGEADQTIRLLGVGNHLSVTVDDFRFI